MSPKKKQASVSRAAFASSSPAPLTSAIKLKRKPVSISSDSSEVEVLDSPSSKKKVRAQPSALTGDKASAILAALNSLDTPVPRHTTQPNDVLNSPSSTKKVCAQPSALTGGKTSAILAALSSLETPVVEDTPRPKRVVKLTEKAKAQAEKPTSRPFIIRPRARGEKLNYASAKHFNSPPGTPSSTEMSGGHESDEDLPSVSELMKTNGPEEEGVNEGDTINDASSIVGSDNGKNDGRESGVEEGGELNSVTNDDNETPAPLANNLVVDAMEDDEPEPVMLPSIQDPILAMSYNDLPHIEKYYAITPFQDTAAVDHAMFTVMARSMAVVDRENLVTLVTKFTIFRQFVYIPRTDPSLLSVDGQKLSMSGRPAICLMPGAVSDSHIVASRFIGRPGFEFAVHGLTVIPLRQEFRCESSVWGSKLGLDPIFYGNVNSLGMSFVTMGEGKGFTQSRQLASSPSTPKKPSSPFVVSVKSPVHPKRGGHSFPSIQTFDERIPIYDGTSATGRPFTFSPADMDNLQNWPKYNNGEGEVPLHSVVVVGYVASWYGQGTTRYFGGNIVFAIVLSVPT